MTAIARAVTARIPHLCDGCHWTPGRRGVPTIGAGHRYLRHITFPDDVVNQSNRPVALKECVACACERDPHAGVLDAGACSTFCHGDVPCALPQRHGGDHSCLRCVAEQAQTR